MIGYQVGSTSAFWGFLISGRNIDSTYVEGVSLTHGTIGARQHIWTFAAGIEESGTLYAVEQCPCDTTSSTVVSPSFVGRDYFCESGLHSNWNSGTMYNRLFLDDPSGMDRAALPLAAHAVSSTTLHGSQGILPTPQPMILKCVCAQTNGLKKQFFLSLLNFT